MNEQIEKCNRQRSASGYFIPNTLEVKRLDLCNTLNIEFIRVFELDRNGTKKYLRSFAILFDNKLLITDNVRKTELFITELTLFERGDKNNVYFEIVTRESAISLKIKNIKENIYVTKSQAKSIVDCYYRVNRNFNMDYAYEDEIALTSYGYNYYLFTDFTVLQQYTEHDELKRFKMFESII